MSKEEEEVLHIVSSGERPRLMPTYVFPNEQPHQIKTLTSSDLRNAELEGAIRDLTAIEKRFRDDDPARDPIANARRSIARLLVISPDNGAGLKVIK